MKKILTTIASAFLLFQASAQKAPFSLPSLPYAFDALEPSIDALTMQIHHGKHHAAYINNLNKAVTGTKFEPQSLEDLLLNVSTTNDAIRNNAGGHYNHSMFWTILSPVGAQEFDPNSALGKAVVQQFGTLDSMKKLLNEAASKRFGSGWAWLSIGKQNKLMITSTANQDNPLMDVLQERGIPILGIDVWEHAYYLKYQNKRGDYLEQIWKVMNWSKINEYYTEALKNMELKDKLKIQ